MVLRETVNFVPENLHVSPSIRGNCYTAHKEKLFRVQIYENKCCKQSTFTGNSAVLPTDVKDIAMFPTQRFWREIVSLLDLM